MVIKLRTYRTPRDRQDEKLGKTISVVAKNGFGFRRAGKTIYDMSELKEDASKWSAALLGVARKALVEATC